MKFSSCYVIGAGGTGSILLEPLARLLTYHPNGTNTIYIYDDDKFEPKNSARQFFDPIYTGKNKAIVAAERLKNLCNAIAVPQYVRRYEFGSELLKHRIESHHKEAILVILAVDSEATRNEVIKELDELPYIIDFACVLPGNDYHTATCVWYTREQGKIFPVHPFDVVSNYASPTDHPRGSCAYEAVSSPQLINANFASALMTNEIVYALLEKMPLPFRLNYDGSKLRMETEGKFKAVLV